MGYITKPDSLADVNERLAIAVSESLEPLEEWAADARVTVRQFKRWLGGTMISSRHLIKLDQMMGDLFLTPPEREWALQAEYLADENLRRRYGRGRRTVR